MVSTVNIHSSLIFASGRFATTCVSEFDCLYSAYSGLTCLSPAFLLDFLTRCSCRWLLWETCSPFSNLFSRDGTKMFLATTITIISRTTCCAQDSEAILFPMAVSSWINTNEEAAKITALHVPAQQLMWYKRVAFLNFLCLAGVSIF